MKLLNLGSKISKKKYKTHNFYLIMDEANNISNDKTNIANELNTEFVGIVKNS